MTKFSNQTSLVTGLKTTRGGWFFGTRMRTLSFWSASAFFFTSLLAASSAQAAFVVTNGLNPKALRNDKVVVAVVVVTGVKADPKRKSKGHLLYRHIDLKVVKKLYGGRVTPAMVRNIPFSPRVNSAWPPVKGQLKGRFFLMAWVHGQPCGLGRTVSFGRLSELPILLTGPKDPKVDAWERFIKLASLKGNRWEQALLRAFADSKRPILARLADEALNSLQRRSMKRHAKRQGKSKRHLRKDSFHRFNGLLHLLKPQPVDPLVGVSLVMALGEFPKVRSESAFKRWVLRSRSTDGKAVRSPHPQPLKTPSFTKWRQTVLKKLLQVARSSKSGSSLRQNTLSLLGEAPLVVASRGDGVNKKAIKGIQDLLKDPNQMVRRAALYALLRAGKKLRHASPKESRAIYRRVVKAKNAEPSKKERALLRRVIKRVW